MLTCSTATCQRNNPEATEVTTWPTTLAFLVLRNVAAEQGLDWGEGSSKIALTVLWWYIWDILRSNCNNPSLLYWFPRLTTRSVSKRQVTWQAAVWQNKSCPPVYNSLGRFIVLILQSRASWATRGDPCNVISPLDAIRVRLAGCFFSLCWTPAGATACDRRLEILVTQQSESHAEHQGFLRHIEHRCSPADSRPARYWARQSCFEEILESRNMVSFHIRLPKLPLHWWMNSVRELVVVDRRR